MRVINSLACGDADYVCDIFLHFSLAAKYPPEIIQHTEKKKPDTGKRRFYPETSFKIIKKW